MVYKYCWHGEGEAFRDDDRKEANPNDILEILLLLLPEMVVEAYSKEIAEVSLRTSEADVAEKQHEKVEENKEEVEVNYPPAFLRTAASQPAAAVIIGTRRSLVAF